MSRDPNIKALKRKEFINQGSTLGRYATRNGINRKHPHREPSKDHP